MVSITTRENFLKALVILLLLLPSCKEDESGVGETVALGPPFAGSSYIDPDIIRTSDPTSFEAIDSLGRSMIDMFDMRTNSWTKENAFLFKISFDDQLTAIIAVNPEFGTHSMAMTEAEKYAILLGKLPRSLRLGVKNVWIHKGNELFFVIEKTMVIYSDAGRSLMLDGFLEEVLIHEAAHLRFDAFHATSEEWKLAQSQDPTFISRYARDHPEREDIAETVGPYLAITFGGNRITESTKNKIIAAIPNRIQYLDRLIWDLYPWQ